MCGECEALWGSKIQNIGIFRMQPGIVVAMPGKDPELVCLLGPCLRDFPFGLVSNSKAFLNSKNRAKARERTSISEVHFLRAKRGSWGVETRVLVSNLKGPLLCVFAQILQLWGVKIFLVASSKFHFLYLR